MDVEAIGCGDQLWHGRCPSCPCTGICVHVLGEKDTFCSDEVYHMYHQPMGAKPHGQPWLSATFSRLLLSFELLGSAQFQPGLSNDEGRAHGGFHFRIEIQRQRFHPSPTEYIHRYIKPQDGPVRRPYNSCERPMYRISWPKRRARANGAFVACCLGVFTYSTA